MRGFAMHNVFTVFSRVVPSGKKVYYYHAYNEDGKRVGPWSTGQMTKTAARNYCAKLIREKKLIPGIVGVPTFAEYAKGWWIWETCPYLKDRRKRYNITKSYADNCRNLTENKLVPYFGKMKLDRISHDILEKWIDDLTAEDYKNSYINSLMKILKVMLFWAVKKNIIPVNPIAGHEKLVETKKKMTIITPEEFKELFVRDWRKVWDNNRIIYTANKLAALTGMRTSEVLGLRGEYVFDTHIYLCAQYDKYGYRPTKNKEQDNIPLTPSMIAELRELMKFNGEGFIFSEDGGQKPIDRSPLYEGFIKALKKIGISDEEIRERGLNLHAWRHFCNTELQNGGLTVKQVQAVIRHKSERETERYTHFNIMQFQEVAKIQDKLLQDDENTGNGKTQGLCLVNPEKKSA
jgi:integrase